MHCDPYAIARVVSPTGRVIFRQGPECTRAIPTDIAEEETAILEDVIGFGTGTAANIGRPAAGKTGTGQDHQDAWFVGYVPQLATGVWVGYANAEIPMPSVPGYGRGFGGVLAAPIWHDFMLLATARKPVEGFAPPPIPLTRPAPSPTPTTSPSLTLPTALGHTVALTRSIGRRTMWPLHRDARRSANRDLGSSEPVSAQAGSCGASTRRNPGSGPRVRDGAGPFCLDIREPAGGG